METGTSVTYDSAARDQEHLNLLSIFHYVVGAFTALFACFPMIHLFIGILFLSGIIKPDRGEEGALVFAGLLFVLIAAFGIIVGWTAALCLIFAGRQLARRKHHTFCFVVACLSCLFVPFGTVLGVFTMMVLLRPSVKQSFGIAPPQVVVPPRV